MKLIAIIEEKDKVTQLYLDKINNQPKFYGFSVKDSKLEKPNDNVLSIFNYFKIGTNVESKGKMEDYDIILDRDSGLLHFFKDGKEDLEKLFMFNGTCADLTLRGYNSYKGKRKGILKIKFDKLIASFICIDLTVIMSVITVLYNSQLNINGEVIDPKISISYIFNSEEEELFSHAIELDDIRDYIYYKSEIKSEKVKDFLWNPELINDVLPYYKGTYLDIVSKIRHYGLNIEVGLDDENLSGEYRYGNTIYMQQFDENGFDENSYNAKTLAHEYVHLLQTTSGYPFVRETSAELIAHEYFCHSSSSKDFYSYSEPLKYLRVLMEIISPEPIWDNAFHQNSTMLDDSIRPFLSEKEFKTFKKIFSLHPYLQMEELISCFPELESILDTLHMNKYGFSMYDDAMINAILNNQEYDRVYFCSSLMQERESYVSTISMDISEAINKEIIKCYISTSITFEQFIDENYPVLIKRTILERLCECEIFNSYFDGTEWFGNVVINGESYTIKEAVQNGYVKINYYALTREVSAEEYLTNPNNPDYAFKSYKLDQNYSIDTENSKVYFNAPDKIYLPSINEKFNTNEKQLK